MMKPGTEWLDGIRWTEQIGGTHDKRHRLVSRPLSGKSVSILGGGPGMTMAHAAKLMNFPTICVNNSYMLMDRPTVVVALDRRWWAWHGGSVYARGDTAVTSLRPNQVPPQGFSGASMSKERTGVYDTDPTVLCGQNSGHAAIHLAMHLGASTIYLVGFDMGFPDGKTHWHGGHQVPSSESNYVRRFRPALEKLCQHADEHKTASIEAITSTSADIKTTDFKVAIERLTADHDNCVDNA